MRRAGAAGKTERHQVSIRLIDATQSDWRCATPVSSTLDISVAHIIEIA
jgi:hypothetical protein